MNDIGEGYLAFHHKVDAKLEIVFRFTPDEGSNPSLSAIYIARRRLLRHDLRSLFVACILLLRRAMPSVEGLSWFGPKVI